VAIDGTEITSLGDHALTKLRRSHIGFIGFQVPWAQLVAFTIVAVIAGCSPRSCPPGARRSSTC
jgi:hypothetical protein